VKHSALNRVEDRLNTRRIANDENSIAAPIDYDERESAAQRFERSGPFGEIAIQELCRRLGRLERGTSRGWCSIQGDGALLGLGHREPS
jgi:hypothetical protein